MFSKKTAVVLIILSLIPLGMSLQAVFFSGSELKVFPLEGRNAKTEAVQVTSDMSPMRLLITMDYGSKGFSTIQRYIEYSVTARAQDEGMLWQETGRASVTGDSKIISDQTHYASLQTFDINHPDTIQFEYKIDEANLRYKGGYLTLKRNVARHNLSITVIGVILLVMGIFIFVSTQKKR